MPRNDLYTRHTIYVVLALEVSSSEPVTGNWLLGVELEASEDEALIPKVGRVWRGRRAIVLLLFSRFVRGRARGIRHLPSSLSPLATSSLLLSSSSSFFFLSFCFVYFFSYSHRVRYISFKMIDIQNYPLHCQILGPAPSTSTSNRTNLPLRTWHPLPSPTIIPFPPW